MFDNLPAERAFTYQEVVTILKQHNFSGINFLLKGGRLDGSIIHNTIDNFIHGMSPHSQGGYNGSFIFDINFDKYVYFCDPQKITIEKEAVVLNFGMKLD